MCIVNKCDDIFVNVWTMNTTVLWTLFNQVMVDHFMRIEKRNQILLNKIEIYLMDDAVFGSIIAFL